jgi:phytoene synthase
VSVVTEPAFEHCRRIARESGSSFYAGMRLLPGDRRQALFAVYALARRIDDIADGSLPATEKLVQLEGVRGQLARIEEMGADEPVLVAVREAARRYPIPLAAFVDLVEGAEMDVRGTTYATFQELVRYCRCVAGSIGRLALGVFETNDREAAVPLADDLGVAFQQTNILRDFGEDLRQGRLYLPQEDLQRFGCSVAEAQVEGPIELVIAYASERALGWLEHGLTLVPLLDRRSSACVLAMAGAYRRLLEQIASEPSLVLDRRLSLKPWEKGWVLARSVVGAVA